MMKYPKEYLEEIKQRLKVSQVVGKSVKLKRRGKEFIGLSPFSNEKTPSFTVNDEKGFYHCFSSAEHGNIFDFLMKTKSYRFGEAVRALAADAGMQPYRFTKQDEEKENRWKIYNAILEKYTNFCHEEIASEKNSEIFFWQSDKWPPVPTLQKTNPVSPKSIWVCLFRNRCPLTHQQLHFFLKWQTKKICHSGKNS